MKDYSRPYLLKSSFSIPKWTSPIFKNKNNKGEEHTDWEGFIAEFLDKKEKIYQKAPDRRMKLGKILLKKGKIQKKNLNIALKVKEKSPKKLGEILLEMGYISKETLHEILSIQAGIAKINLLLDQKVYLKEVIPPALMEKAGFFCFEFLPQEKKISIVTYDPLIVSLIFGLFIGLYPQFNITLFMGEEGRIKAILKRNFKREINTEIKISKIPNLDLRESVLKTKLFLGSICKGEVFTDNLGESIWLKTESKNLKFSVYITKK